MPNTRVDSAWCVDESCANVSWYMSGWDGWLACPAGDLPWRIGSLCEQGCRVSRICRGVSMTRGQASFVTPLHGCVCSSFAPILYSTGWNIAHADTARLDETGRGRWEGMFVNRPKTSRTLGLSGVYLLGHAWGAGSSQSFVLHTIVVSSRGGERSMV